jgi:hypothetical protein
LSYVYKDINELAAFLDVLASDQRALMRIIRSPRERRDVEIRAATYADAATILREAKFAPTGEK